MAKQVENAGSPIVCEQKVPLLPINDVNKQ